MQKSAGKKSRGRKFVGSKAGSGVWQSIISEMPPHSVYVEAFLGTGIILRKKKSSNGADIGIDSDAAAWGFDLCAPLPSFVGLVANAVTVLPGMIPFMSHDWLLYCDPPYLRSTRSYKKRYYKHEFDQPAQHGALLRLLKSLPCNVMISGYHSPLYAKMLKRWRTIEIPTVTRTGQRRMEVLWMNFPEPFEFHDTRYLGKNYRERERIKRKKARWIARLKRISRLDRAAILEAIETLRNTPSNMTVPAANDPTPSKLARTDRRIKIR